MGSLERAETFGGAVAACLQSAGRRTRAEELVAGWPTAAADADFEQRAALGAVVGLNERAAPVGSVLAANAAAGVGLEFESFGRDRFAADFADDDIFPTVAVGLIGIERQLKRRLLAPIASEVLAVSPQNLAHDLLRRIGRAAEMTEGTKPSNNLRFTAKGPPTAILAL